MKFRKILAMLLVLLMAMGTLTIAVNAESMSNRTDGAGFKVYFYNEKNWATPYLYCYEGSKTNSTWPGQAMKAEADGWYSYEISGYSQPRVIFSNKGVTQVPSQNQEGYLVSESKWFLKGVWYDEQPEGITLHYFNENRWEQPYVYYYYETNTPIDWPGVPMNSEGDGWYNYTVYGMDQVYAIFSDKGKNQDPKYTDYDDDGYSFNGEMWVAHKLAYGEKPDRVTVHFYNKDAWEEPYVYHYIGRYIQSGWPGDPMLKDDFGWYSYDVFGSEEIMVLFSDNGKSQIPGSDSEGFSVTNEGWFYDGQMYESEPVGTTVHFYNYDNWNKVNMYYYDGAITGSDWSGMPMRSEGDGWYSYKIPELKQAKVLFNNGGSTQIPERFEEGFSVSGEKWYRNGAWTNERPKDITVHFYKPTNWSAPNLYYYINDNDNGGAWPGQKMKNGGDGWYSYKITRYSEAKVIFNDGTNQIPGKMQEGHSLSENMWYKDGFWYNESDDTDGDGLLDYEELLLGTNPRKADTDEDGLPDGYELLTSKTDPLNKDTDSNGINDSDEDFDGDRLNNLQEFQYKTEPYNSDTDYDGLSDYDEIFVYFTNPLVSDTDKDGLLDGDDVALGFDPLNPDSNGNGVLDGNEKIQQQLTQPIEEPESPAITDVRVEFSLNGNIDTTTKIENIYGIDKKSTGVVGLVGVPIEITTTAEFNTAVITFTYDKTELGDTLEENLSIMWYDEENDWYQLLDKESVLNKTDGTISCSTTHFSKYMVVDKEKWFETWRRTIDYRDGIGEPTYYDFAFVVDTSGSMSGSSIREAKSAMNGFVDALADQDDGCIVRFEDYATLVKGFGSTKAELHSGVNSLSASGGTSVNAGLTMGVNQLIHHSSQNKKVVILICDGDVNSVTSIVDTAVKNHIAIYTINVVSSSQSTLEWIAKQTGGEYYHAYTAEQLLDAFSHIASDNLFDFSLQDSDNDGLPDTFETNGMRTSNGQIIYTNPLKYDTDGDGISDGEEMGILHSGVELNGLGYVPFPENGVYLGGNTHIKNSFYFDMVSDPNEYTISADGVLKRAYGFNKEQAELLQKTYRYVIKSYSNLGVKDRVNKYYGLLASLCFNYDSTRWYMTANTKSRQDASNDLIWCGMTGQEVLDLTVMINVQHGSPNAAFAKNNVDLSKSNFSGITTKDYLSATTVYPKDFAHELIQFAIFSNEDNPGVARTLVDAYNAVNGKIYTNYEGSFKGDIDSTRYDPENGDFSSDIDAINCYDIMKKNNTDVFQVLVDYNDAIQKGNKNMGLEFFKSLGQGSVGIGMYEMRDILDADTQGSRMIREGLPSEILKKSESDFLSLVFYEYGKVG